MAVLASLTFSGIAFSAPQFGAWVGQAQVGEKLKVNMTVFGLSKDTQSQLKATCMEAWAESDGNELNSLQTRIPLNLDYGKTLDRGGLVTLTSNVSMRDPVVRVHVASNCPLVTFVQTWDLQLDFVPSGQIKATAGSINANSPAVRGKGLSESADEPTPFSLSGSSTLAASFRKPVLKAEPAAQTTQFIPVLASTKPEKTKTVEGKNAQEGSARDKSISEPMPGKNQNLVTLPQTREDLAMLQAPQQPSQQQPSQQQSQNQSQQPAQLENMAMSKLSDQAANDTGQQALNSQASAPVSASINGWAKDPALTGDEMNLIPFILFGAVSLLMIAFGIWWGQRQSAASDVKVGSLNLGFAKLFHKVKPSIKIQPASIRPSSNSEHLEADDNPERTNAGSLDSENVDPQAGNTKPVANKSNSKDLDPISKQLFESFLGGTQSLDASADSHSNRAIKPTKSSQNEVKSLVSMVSSSQNISPGPWKLPEAFLPLLPASLVTDWTIDQFTEDRLKCEMGLIELAFLNAQQGEVLYDIQIAELLETLNSGKAYEQAIHAPSDLIKDFVRSRVCELDSKQAIEKFTESLIAMNSSKHCEKFCMADELWLEFISDLDIR